MPAVPPGVALIEADATTFDPSEVAMELPAAAGGHVEGVQVRHESVRGGHIQVVAATIP